MDMISPELQTVEANQIYEVAGKLPENAQIRIQVAGETLEGKAVDKVVMLPVGKIADGETRLRDASGLELRDEDGVLFVDNVVFGGVAEKQKIDFDWEIKSVQVKNENRPAKQWFYLLALGLIAIVWFAQKGRIRRDNSDDELKAIEEAERAEKEATMAAEAEQAAYETERASAIEEAPVAAYSHAPNINFKRRPSSNPPDENM